MGQRIDFDAGGGGCDAGHADKSAGEREEMTPHVKSLV